MINRLTTIQKVPDKKGTKIIKKLVSQIAKSLMPDHDHQERDINLNLNHNLNLHLAIGHLHITQHNLKCVVVEMQVVLDRHQDDMLEMAHH